jgi:hypothetical protein
MGVEWEAWTGIRAQKLAMTACTVGLLWRLGAELNTPWVWLLAVVMWAAESITYLEGFAQAIVAVHQLSPEQRTYMFQQLDQAEKSGASREQ